MHPLGGCRRVAVQGQLKEGALWRRAEGRFTLYILRLGILPWMRVPTQLCPGMPNVKWHHFDPGNGSRTRLPEP